MYTIVTQTYFQDLKPQQHFFKHDTPLQRVDEVTILTYHTKPFSASCTRQTR